MLNRLIYKATRTTVNRALNLQTFKEFAGRAGKMSGESDNHITRVLFCGPYFPASHNYTREYLQEYPFIKVDDVPVSDIPAVIGDYHLCIVKNFRLNSDLIARANQMKIIMQFGVGLEGVDVDSATSCGVKVARIPGDVTGNAASCAEMAIYLMLGLLRKQTEMQLAVKNRQLGEPVGVPLLGKTVFIMGYGNIGIDLAKRLRPFGVKIIATKRSWPVSDDCVNDDLIDEKGNHKDIHDFASKADIIVCCLSMNTETAGIVNHEFLSSMKKGCVLLNIARGGLLDYESVSYHLKSGQLGGLGIDVAWIEPFDPEDPILKHPNVIITPHVAGVTEYSYRSMAKVVGDVALQIHKGTPVTGIEFVN
ncbi:hydroxypyruvate reductase [Impatiens glandulifera]|uniref:hydroxypyruvate reductase n=1 Tax=Impatiens glandulifera TaxID=253017 RepID=UPI001FB0B07C|nr:hydroxypyruvate reductase [Impatiens glandulifera]